VKVFKTPEKSKRKALVIGGASGIGWAVAQRLHNAGSDVIVADINAAQTGRIADAGQIVTVRLDATNFAEVKALVEMHGPFDILVNAAGIDQHAFFTQTYPDDWRKLIAVNLDSVLNTTHAVLPGMQAIGYGRIVNIASEAGRLGSRGGSVYAAAKGGVIAFTRSIARENSALGITANIVAPGPIDTPMLQRGIELKGEKLLNAMKGATLVGRLGTPDEVAAAVEFLASDIAGYITGEVLGVSGGMGCGA
jgi:2-hydroxycyclohexanecarboxyl-CoA dehydrogenase